MDFSALSNDQMISLIEEALVECKKRGDATINVATKKCLTAKEEADARNEGIEEAAKVWQANEIRRIKNEAIALEKARLFTPDKALNDAKQEIETKVQSFYEMGAELYVYSGPTGMDRRVYINSTGRRSASPPGQLVSYFHDGNAQHKAGAMLLTPEGQKVAYPTNTVQLSEFLASIATKYSVLYVECKPFVKPAPKPKPMDGKSWDAGYQGIFVDHLGNVHTAGRRQTYGSQVPKVWPGARVIINDRMKSHYGLTGTVTEIRSNYVAHTSYDEIAIVQFDSGSFFAFKMSELELISGQPNPSTAQGNPFIEGINELKGALGSCFADHGTFKPKPGTIIEDSRGLHWKRIDGGWIPDDDLFGEDIMDVDLGI